MTGKQYRLAGMILALLLAAFAAAQEPEYSPVTDERLTNPGPGDWLHYRGTYDGWGYSTLDSINKENVAGLTPVWTFATGVLSGHESPPMVNDGVMFITTPMAQVIALDALTGDLLWRYQRELPPGTTMLHNTNRGVGFYGDLVFLGSHDAYLTALNATTGVVVWEQKLAETLEGYYITLAPLIAEGKVILGVSGGERGVRGFIQAFDAETGDSVWKTYTVPGPGEPGNETWPGDTWMHGGASIWVTGTYDPETGLSYWGTGNGAPWLGAATRPGDNLYATSAVVVDVETGEIVSHFQYQPNDTWDWDEVSAPMLIDIERDGQTIPAAVHAARSGYLYLLDRSDGELNFIDAEPYVFNNVFLGFEEDGRPIYDPERIPFLGSATEFCPSLWGGKDWPPAAWNPETRLLYIPVNDNHCGSIEGFDVEYVAGQSYTGARTTFSITEGAEYIGELQAWNLDTLEEGWSVKIESHNWGPVLTTAGGLVFMGGTNDRYFRAFDAETGDKLWEFRTNSGVIGVPSTFEIDGVQYLAVQSGWGVDAQSMQGRIADQLGWDPDVPQGGVVWVFALPEGPESNP
jgi:alcohol dehydrogenase (cytochrome c)